MSQVLKVLTAEIVEGIGKKSQKPYVAVDVVFDCPLPGGFSKRLFLDSRDRQILGVK